MRRFLKGMAVACLVLALAAPAMAGSFVKKAAVMSDDNGRWVDNTFYQTEGDSVLFHYHVDGPAVQDTASILIGPTGNPGWLLVDFEEEAAALTAWFRFKQAVDGGTLSYTWGDWVPLRLDGAAVTHAFNVGLWDSCKVVVVGSGNGKMRCFWRVENISD